MKSVRDDRVFHQRACARARARVCVCVYVGVSHCIPSTHPPRGPPCAGRSAPHRLAQTPARKPVRAPPRHPRQPDTHCARPVVYMYAYMCVSGQPTDISHAHGADGPPSRGGAARTPTMYSVYGGCRPVPAFLRRPNTNTSRVPEALLPNGSNTWFRRGDSNIGRTEPRTARRAGEPPSSSTRHNDLPPSVWGAASCASWVRRFVVSTLDG